MLTWVCNQCIVYYCANLFSLSPAPTISQLSASSTAVQFGTPLTLTCSFTTSNTLARVEWLLNGEIVESASLTSENTEAMFTVNNFTMDGVYQCRVYNENGDSSTESLFISGTGRLNFNFGLVENFESLSLETRLSNFLCIQ